MITNKEKQFVSVVVYMYNNAITIATFLERISAFFDDNFQNFEIICVNDASNDETVKAIKNSEKLNKNCMLSIVNMSYFQGIETSMKAGVDLAIGDFVFEFDTVNIDYELNVIIEVYNKAVSGYDIVAAGSGRKHFISNSFYKLYNKYSGAQYKLEGESFRILSRRAINRVHSMSKALFYRKAMYANCGLMNSIIKYVPIRTIRYSHIYPQFKNNQETALNTLILFTDVSYRITMKFSLAMMLTTMATAFYVLIVFILNRPVPGFTPIMLVMTGSFFGVFAILAIIIKYLSLLINMVFKSQNYLISSIEKITK